MSTFAVTAEQLVILPHPNADALDMAVIGGYRAVVRKGQYQTGDWAIYIPEQALLPAGLVEEFGLTGRLAGKAANRVKAIRLRGELSQGIVCRPIALAGIDLSAVAGRDFATDLEIVKWVPEVPATMSGQIEPAPTLVRWIDIENIKRYPEMFVAGEPVTATEKAHGTCCVFSMDLDEDRIHVSSKGFADKSQAIIEAPDNLYWRAVRYHDLESKARAIAARLGVRRLGIFGEVYGAGVQDLTYGITSRNTPGYAVFDIAVVDAGGQRAWLDQGAVRALCTEQDLPMVPQLYCGPYDYATLAGLAEGDTVLGGGANIREGLVVRPAIERASALTGGRTIAKFVSSAYLTRHNGTEYE